MHRSDRLTGILIALQGGPRTAAALAARFEVSRRTIMRDIDALAGIGVPIIAEAGRNGGYRIADGFWLPPLHLTAEEATVLIFALEHVGDDTRSPLGDAHRTVREKISSILTPTVESDVARNLSALNVLREHDEPEPAVIELLRAAIPHRQWIAIVYRSPRGESERAILPIRLSVSAGRWYVEAVDSLREQYRHFRVSRILRARKTVPPPNAAASIEAVEASEGTYHDDAHPLVQVALTPAGIALAKDHPDFHRHLVESRLEFRCPPSELPFYGRELLRFGLEAHIDGPQELIGWIRHHLQQLSQHHGHPAQEEQ